jgi:hypothetical protein
MMVQTTGRLFDALDLMRRWHFGRVVDFESFARNTRDAIHHARRSRDQREVIFALQPLLDNIHVEQTEKSAAKAEAQSRT